MAQFRTTEINQIINSERAKRLISESGKEVNDLSGKKWKELNVEWKQAIHSKESVLNDSEPASS